MTPLLPSDQSKGAAGTSWFKTCQKHRYAESPRTTHPFGTKNGRCAECGKWWAWNTVKP